MTAIIYKVYILPKEKYCGCTKRDFEKRLWEHKNLKGRNIEGAFILAEFPTKKEAFEFEKRMQLDSGYSGYIFGKEWRKLQSEKCLRDKPSTARQKKIICIDTGAVFNSVRSCERFYKKKSGNLSKHLKGEQNHQTFAGLKFKFL